jgi:lipoprotein-anchoring transpeptidase ErfK/SrfK
VAVALAAVALLAPAAPSAPAATTPISAPSRDAGAETALIAAATAAFSRPGGGRVVTHLRGETTWSREAQVLLVVGSAEVAGREWLQVLLPVRPSGRSGWIPANRVSLRPDHLWLELDKGSRRLRAYLDGRLVRHYRVVIGRAATPTPSGLAAVYEVDRQPDPTGFLGPWALPLTALSPVLRSFGGGPGRIAIHGRDGESLADPLGSAASHGCIRIPNAGIRWLAAHAAQGTPVRIVG